MNGNEKHRIHFFKMLYYIRKSVLKGYILYAYLWKCSSLFNAKDSVFRLGDRKIWSDKRKNYGGVFCLELVKE